jgi:NIMA (never in mitosis gene a)-related kinase
MAERENSNSWSSDKSSLMSNERNAAKAASKGDNKITEVDLASIDDNESDLMPGGKGISSSNVNAKTDKQEIRKQTHIAHHSNVGSKQAKAVKNVMIAPKHEKVRETSAPMRCSLMKAGDISIQKINTETLSKLPKPDFGATGLKPNLEVPAIGPSKETLNCAKRIQGSHATKHQVHYH